MTAGTVATMSRPMSFLHRMAQKAYNILPENHKDGHQGAYMHHDVEKQHIAAIDAHGIWNNTGARCWTRAKTP